jgi:hypothetical protein
LIIAINTGKVQMRYVLSPLVIIVGVLLCILVRNGFSEEKFMKKYQKKKR